MNAISHIVAGTMPKMSAVAPVGKLTVEVTWSEGSRAPRKEKVDLAPLINSMKFYKPLRNNQVLFETVHLIDNGEVLAWGADDAIDMPATSVVRLAEDMMTADAFREFLTLVKYTHTTAAAQLGYSRRQIENFLAGDHIPRVCVLACSALQHRYLARQAQFTYASTLLSTRRVPDQSKHVLPSATRSLLFSPHTHLHTVSAFFNAHLQSTAATYDAP